MARCVSPPQLATRVPEPHRLSIGPALGLAARTGNSATRPPDKHQTLLGLARRQAGVTLHGAAPLLLIWIAKTSLDFLAGMADDSYYPAEKKMSKTWNAGRAPNVSVDLFAGYINVVQSIDDRVSAVFSTTAAFKHSQAGANAAVNGILISNDHEGGTIRIRATNPRNLRALHPRTDVELRVPPGASLDLLTGHGYIHIGRG